VLLVHAPRASASKASNGAKYALCWYFNWYTPSTFMGQPLSAQDLTLLNQ